VEYGHLLDGAGTLSNAITTAASCLIVVRMASSEVRGGGKRRHHLRIPMEHVGKGIDKGVGQVGYRFAFNCGNSMQRQVDKPYHH
jgi:hypothetical protein